MGPEKGISRCQLSESQKIGKQAFYKQYEMHLEDAYDYTSRLMANNALMEDAKEGIASFLEKRNPSWRNKS